MPKKTPFYDFHIKHNGKMVDFGGWLMPVQYAPIQSEHTAVRTNAGLFDASHMGEFIIEGKEALNFADYLVTNSLSDKNNGKTIYSPLCNEQGCFIDDLLVYKFHDEKLMFVVNASNIQKDWDWIKKQSLSFNINLINTSSTTSLLALQGPKSLAILSNLTEHTEKLQNLEYYSFYEDTIQNIPVLISRTGYTGELGFEIYFDSQHSSTIIELLMQAGKPADMALCGLGARDSLRLEKAYLLYGNDMNEQTTPLEADIAWTVKFHKNFIGKEALKRQKITKKLIGFEMIDNRIPRHGYQIFSEDNQLIGKVTSGGIGFSLHKNIGMGYISLPYTEIGTNIYIDIRGKKFPAAVVKTPFVS